MLPFAGLEMLALGIALYRCSLNARGCEIVFIHDDLVEIQRERQGRDGCLSFQRAWARAVLSRRQGGWYPSRLTIRSHGREVEVGRYLSEDERERLANDLGEFIVLQRM